MRDPGLNTRTSVATPDDVARSLSPPWDVLAAPVVEDLLPSAMNFWPRGAAFGTPDWVAAEADSNWARLMRALLAPFVELYQRSFLLARESTPALLSETLDQWETEYGLPEPCVTTAQSRAERLAFLAAKVNAAPLITPGDFIRIAAEYGFSIEIEEPAIFECGFSEVGGEHTVGDWRQEVYWIVKVDDLAVYYFTTGESELAADPLFSFGDAEQLLCILRRLAPGWTVPILQLAD
nr:putative phage tail protein [Mesorhizobium sp.]